MTPKAHDLPVRELLVFYYKYRTRLLASFFVPFLFLFVLSFLPAPRYSASSVLIVRMGSEYVYQPEVGATRNGIQPTIPFDRDQIFKSEVAILGSDDLHREVVTQIGVDRILAKSAVGAVLEDLRQSLSDVMGFAWLDVQNLEPRRLAKAVSRFDKRLSLRLEKESAVITVSYEHKDPEVAVEALETLLKLYMAKRKELYQESRIDVAQMQVDATQARAEDAQGAVEDYKRKHRIYSLDEQRLTLLKARSEVERQRISLSSPSLDEKAGLYNRQLDQLDARERELSRLLHEKQIAEDEYALSTHKLNEAKAFEDLERERSGSVRIIQAPSVAAEPKNYQMMIIVAALFISLLSMLGMAALTQCFDSGYLTPERLERNLGVPVLSVVSRRDQRRA